MDKQSFNKLLEELTVPVKLKQLRDGTGPGPAEYKHVSKSQIKQCEYCPKQVKDQVIAAKVMYPKNPLRRYTKHECNCGKILYQNGKILLTKDEAIMDRLRQKELNAPENWVITKANLPKP